MYVYVFAVFAALLIAGATACEKVHSQKTEAAPAASAPANGGFPSQIAWGEHLVVVAGCDDCHSPKKMTAEGPVTDETRRLSGHPADGTIPTFERKSPESMGWTITNEHLTAWQGPWGTSFTANLTPDDTGIGTWTEEQFATAIRKGKFKGMESSRMLLPPMPWFNYAHFTDDELKAVFAFLKSLPPVKNAVPAPIPPAS